MIEADILREKFQVVSETQRKLKRQRMVILIYLGMVALLLIIMSHPSWVPKEWRVRFLQGLTVPVFVGGLLAWLVYRRSATPLEIARKLEARDPQIDGLAITAAELLEKPDPTFLDRRVISEFTDRAATQDWSKMLLGWRRGLWGSRSLIIATLMLMASAILSTRAVWKYDHRPKEVAKVPEVEAVQTTAPDFSATISPGDTEVERGTRLVVEATFAKDVPADATLVVSELDGKERDRIPMKLTVDEKVFGGMIARVDKDARYQVEFGEGKSKQHSITTFVYPALERVDVKITPPAYTKLPSKEIKNTLKVTAMDNSSIDFTLKVNKPLKEAELFGEDKTALKLTPSPKDPTLLVATMKAEKTQKWRVHLVDDKDRANKNPPWISVTVTQNQLAKIEVVFPKRDVQVSQIEELPVEARVWDDLGVMKSGASFSIAGKTKEVTFKHGTTEPAKKQEVKELLALENESTQPRQLVSYHFWAEDTGPQGEVRRAMSDMFFAEVRHFEDIFREGQSQPGEEGKEPKGETDKLVELQKQIVNATWRIVRDTNAGKTMEVAATDASVVHESQGMALEQTKEAMEKVEDAQIKNALTEAWKSMKDALDPLEQAAEQKKRASLNQALTFEQSALEWLHQAQSREHMITRSKSKSKSSGKQKQMQNQLMNLELKQEEQRYEEEKQATEEQTAEQQENLQVLNRLKELARRQEALAEKMKELQKQLDKAKTEQEKQELQNQLKRLEKEQEQLLRDVDDLQERMEKPENSANMAEAKQQLEQTREQVNEAAEKLKQQQLADAANAATRAQRELEKMQEDFKEKTAKRFGDEMKQMRQQAREATEKQKQIAEALENQKTPDKGQKDTSASLEKMLQGGDVSRQIQDQQEKVAKLLEDMKRVSEQAEGNNPMLHRRLYEAVREAKTGGLEEHLDEARTQSRYGQRAEAQDAERKANTLVDQLQQGVEKAAESVLGSETEALRMARTELDKLIQEASQEGQKGEPGNAGVPTRKQGEEEKAAGQSGDPKGQMAQGQQPAKEKGEQPGQNSKGPASEDTRAPQGKPGEQPGQQQANAQGQGKKPGETPGQRQKPGEQPGQGQQQAQAGSKPKEGQGQQPGQQGQEGQGGQQGEGQQPGSQPGQMAQGEGQQPGQQPGQSPGQGGQASGQSQGSPSESQQRGQQTAANRSPNQNGGNRGNSAGGASGGGDDGGALFFDQGAEAVNDRPFTGDGYDRWSNRLRNVEELLEQPELRNEAAKVLDNAREMRIDHARNDAAPQADHLKMRIVNPLVELRDRVAEELAKRDTKNPMVPVDRDPVPPAFRELVKRYYQELGNGN
ncbi:MAG: hypothetical protein V4662_15060 [Verrucomicrobiota bacterium]